MAEAKIGVIGGSGLYEMSSLADLQEVRPNTPYGPPSDVITIGQIEGIATAFLPRHGCGHRLLPRRGAHGSKHIRTERLWALSESFRSARWEASRKRCIHWISLCPIS